MRKRELNQSSKSSEHNNKRIEYGLQIEYGRIYRHWQFQMLVSYPLYTYSSYIVTLYIYSAYFRGVLQIFYILLKK